MQRYMIKQLSIFVENRRGELNDTIALLSEHNISIKSINLVDSIEFGILRVIVDNNEKAKETLHDAGFSLKQTDVFAVQIDDHIGSFGEVVKNLSEHNINIEYTYTVCHKNGAAFIFKVDAKDFIKTTEVLSTCDEVTLLKEI